MYSRGRLHMVMQRQDDQLEPTYSSSVSIPDVTLKTCRKQWTIGRGGERGSGISVLMARHDDDDEFCVYTLFVSGFVYCVGHSLSVRKAAPRCNSLLQDFRNGILYYVIFIPEAPMQRFPSAWVSIWRHYIGFEKSWMSPMVITKVWQLGNFTLIVLIRKELLNFLVRSKPRLTTIPTSQSGPQPKTY